MLCEAESKVVVIALAHSSKQLVGAIERQKKSCIDTAGQDMVEQEKSIHCYRKTVVTEIPGKQIPYEKTVGLERGKCNFII